jgi:hypothetical protein
VKQQLEKMLKFIDIIMIPFVFFSAWILKLVRMAGVQRMPFSKKILNAIGVFPLKNHYYEPQFTFTDQEKRDFDNRSLKGVDFNDDVQLALLDKLIYADELKGLPQDSNREGEYYLTNRNFLAGDAEFLYQVLRHFKPGNLIEVGSGFSTLMAQKALEMNASESDTYACRHLCIEPFEMPWLEKSGVEIIREKVESVNLALFSALKKNDILFIDSSHVIRPNGDVLFEYLTLLPSLNSGVIVHIHDIFSPENYPDQWIDGEVRLWNEQYLLEAFLTHNDSWEIIAGLNYLHQKYENQLNKVSPYLKSDHKPGSFYIRRK